MTTYAITAPDGSRYRVVAPEGASEQDALAYVKKNQASLPKLGPAPDEKGFPYDKPGTEYGNVLPFAKDTATGNVSLAFPEMIRAPVRGMVERGKDLMGVGKEPSAKTQTTPDDIAALAAGAVRSPAAGTGKALSALNPGELSAQRQLMNKGVQLTPGQMAGGIPRRAEEAFKSFPILGSFIRSAEGRSIESFNDAVVDQALDPIGKQLPKAVKSGHAALSYADEQFDKAYDAIKGKITFRADQQFMKDTVDIAKNVAELPPQMRQQFATVMKNRFTSKLAPNGIMTGEDFKAAESDLGRIAAQYMSSPDPAQRAMAHAINEMKFAMRSNLARVNPASAEELNKINAGYAILVRAQNAAARRATSSGVFSPSDLLQSIKSGDKSIRKKDFAQGDSLMQGFAEAAQKVLPSKMPDSGTTERALWDAAGLSTGLLRPEIPLGLGAMSLPYTRPGMNVLNSIFGGKTP